MLILQREYDDGLEVPELVMVHAAGREGTGNPRVFTVVATPAGNGRRVARLFLPDPQPGAPARLSYRFSVVRCGALSHSPLFTVDLTEEETRGDITAVEERGTGNLRPAPGLRMFRLRLPLRPGSGGDGRVRYGFGAMRKKPSPDLCSVVLPLSGGPVVVEAPEALSVLKNRPMPYFLYHWTGDERNLAADKIASIRVPFRDDEGSVAWAWLLWSDPDWTAPNVSLMVPRGVDPENRASEELFLDEAPEAALLARWRSMTSMPHPRTFEAYAFGPAGTRVEYCFLLARYDGSGALSVAWINREDGGNWNVEL